MFKVIVHRQAVRYLSKLPKSQKERIKGVLRKLEKEPFHQPDIKHMLGEWKGYHRIRIGNVRIIFWIDEKENTIYVDHIGSRGDIYK